MRRLLAAFAVQEQLKHQLQCRVWSKGLVEPKKTAIEVLVKALDNYDFPIFIFVLGDIVTIRDQRSERVRDNVLFELGLSR